MEIGSEYYASSAKSGTNYYKSLAEYPERYVLSGRTGLSLIAEELKSKTRTNHIFMPDYCCGSMIYPFTNQGFRVSFYDAFNLKSVTLDDTIGAVLIMDYFGFVSEDTLNFAQQCRAKGKTVIVDATQTAFSFAKTYEIADYIIVSYRKWLDCLCAVVYSKDGFVTKEYTAENTCYNEIWRQAAVLKENFIRNGEGEKQSFLSLYAQANNSLDAEYQGFRANAQEISALENVDSAFLRERRRNNAQLLISEIEKLSKIYDIKLIYTNINKEDCPLFVPILLNENKRADIRAVMSKENIYCPCHWPIDKRYTFKETDYHKKEMSLICDQRYTEEDMQMQIDVLAYALSRSI